MGEGVLVGSTLGEGSTVGDAFGDAPGDGLAGAFVWFHNGDAMPDTAKAIALTVFGYVGATATARARA